METVILEQRQINVEHPELFDTLIWIVNRASVAVGKYLTVKCRCVCTIHLIHCTQIIILEHGAKANGRSLKL